MVDVRGDVLRPPHGTTPAAVKSNIKSEMRSFKSNENIHKKEGGNPPFISGDRAQTRLISTVFYSVVTWKLDQGHKNVIKSLNHPNVTMYDVCPESARIRHLVQKIGCRQAFLVKME